MKVEEEREKKKKSSWIKEKSYYDVKDNGDKPL